GSVNRFKVAVVMRCKGLLLWVCIVALVPLACYGKENKDLLKPNYYYSHYAYSKAIPHLEELCKNNATVDLLEKLAECYRLTGNVEGAIANYRKAVDSGGCKPLTYLHYGQSLMRSGAYTEAAAQLE